MFTIFSHGKAQFRLDVDSFGCAWLRVANAGFTLEFAHCLVQIQRANILFFDVMTISELRTSE